MATKNHVGISHLQLPLLSLSLLVILFTQNVSSQICNPYDKRILLQIKANLGNPPSFDSWNPNTDCCHGWFSNTVLDVYCDDQGHVTGLWLSMADDLSIDLLPALGALPFLEYLMIDSIKSFSNPIPTSVCTKFKRLNYLTVTGCDLNGTIPDCLNQLQNLKNLDLSNNRLTGKIPTTLGQIPNLLELNLHGNQLTGSIPEFSSSRNGMYWLSLGSNQLSGPIPTHLGLMSNLSYLALPNNKFNGSLPVNLGYVESLRYLDLSSNDFHGKIPGSYGKLTDSIILKLNDNHLTGRLPNTMRRFNPMELNLARNYRLDGDAMFLFARDRSWVNSVDISHNRFWFNITDLVPPPELRSLNISHNKIYGSFPVQLGSQLPYFNIDVSYNRLCGPIPQGWENFSPVYFYHNKCLCGRPLDACK